jgi:hypothetical protein
MLYNTLFKKMIHNFLMHLLTRKNEQKTGAIEGDDRQGISVRKRNIITWTLLAFLLQGGMFYLNYTLYQYDLKNKKAEVLWRVNIANNIGSTAEVQWKYLAEKSFTDGGMSGAVIGMILGLAW